MRARLASQNAHKLEELRAALPGWELELLEADGYPDEDGATYRENARAKARFGRPLAPADAWVLGEDSGIEADALGGEPGVRSARWAGDGGDPVAELLRRLDGPGDRRARMRCHLVALPPSGGEVAVEGVLEGAVAGEPRGAGGFGYDPVFVPVGEELTVAELGDAWKRANSHRARAARALAEALGAG